MQASTFKDSLTQLAKEFTVSDIITPSTKLIFILESPHVQELKYGAPVSGSSGSTMTKHLFGDEYAKFPLGRLIRQNVDHEVHRPRLDALGLVNVCNVPMQAAAYGSSPLRQIHADAIRTLEFIRSNNQRDSYSDEQCNHGQALLVESLRRKLLKQTDASLVVVPCGRFAQKFFRLANVTSPHWKVIHGIPHPSYNSWDRARYQEPVSELKSVFQTL
ncbi:hypothetical protein [Alicyclobacillus sp. SO9]|uniref:hypothetical protein n=1 Tax=Alicyclobacillus sp. SO9 TaxID=2665646 RepID=UPI0018E877CF|nr:hypothetical protein [Alicyclobacillus sp. SO9]QQE79926.1 hypothetical protein GI364_05445 [Alicyclobacillus sp. SO9]